MFISITLWPNDFLFGRHIQSSQLFFSRSHTTETSRSEAPLPPLVPTPPSAHLNRAPRPLGRPPHCAGTSALYQEGDDSPCPSYCCADGLVPTAAKLPVVQEAVYVHEEDASNPQTKNNEGELVGDTFLCNGKGALFMNNVV